MFKKALLAGSALFIATAAFAANIPNQTFWDPTNALGTINSVIQSINGGVTGNLATLTAAVVTTDTSADVLFSSTVIGGSLIPGQVLHVKAIGVNSADANVKTVTFTLGTKTCAVVVTGNAAGWTADFWVTITAIGASPTQTDACIAQQGTSAIAPVQSTATQATGGNLTLSVSGTAATSGTMTLNQSWVEVLR